jgi:hypothetical protein
LSKKMVYRGAQICSRLYLPKIHRMKVTFILVSCLLLHSCAGIKTSYDYDLMIDFSKYQTYSFSSRSEQYLSSINGPRLLAAIDHEMMRRSFRKTDDADVVIDILVKREEKEKTITNYNNVSQWSEGYSVGFRVAEVSTEKYGEGTVFINMLDVRQKKVVWQVRATKLLRENSSPKRRQANIDKAVAKMFKYYPFRVNNF